MFIIDADGNETILFDDDTCSHDGLPIMEFNLSGFEGRESAYTAYADAQSPNATPSGLGFVLFNPYDSDEDYFFDTRDPDNSVGDTLVLPYWISRELKDGSTLFIQVNLDITYSDLYFIGAFYAIMGVIILLTFIFLMVISIVNARRENRLVKLLFADSISNDRNWLWFVSRGSKVLKKGTKRGARYAIVSLMFVKYRNYVLCHSIDEGEKMLRNVYSVLAASLNKGEIAAHSTEAKFPMLLRYTDRDELKTRLEGIIEKLQKIDDNHNHKFAFQVGVSLIRDSDRQKKACQEF
jgi:GGDEF domain-containing protein